MDAAAGVDVGQAIAQRQHLGLAQRRAQGLDLAVDVRLGDMVEVDQRQFGQPAARERLGGPGAHAADADHRGPAGAQRAVAGVAVEAAQAAEATLEVGVVGALRHALGQRRAGGGRRCRGKGDGQPRGHQAMRSSRQIW